MSIQQAKARYQFCWALIGAHIFMESTGDAKPSVILPATGKLMEGLINNPDPH